MAARVAGALPPEFVRLAQMASVAFHLLKLALAVGKVRLEYLAGMVSTEGSAFIEMRLGPASDLGLHLPL